MNKIDLSIKLRPIRFLFLVRPNDIKSLQRIFEINTCLWGGMYNPIVPYFKRVPNWWEESFKSHYTARKILEYHIEFFEPDFIVESDQDMVNFLNVSKDVTLQLDDIIKPPSNRYSYEGYGLNVFELYKYLYQKEFKFVRKHELKIIDVKPEIKKFKNFCSCIFGSFPTSEKLLNIKSGFKRALDPKEVSLNQNKLSSLYSEYFISALNIGCEKVELFHSNRRDPTLFILDAFDSRDLIDYWNLRILEGNVIAIPIQWIEQLSDFCKQFIRKNYRPLPGNPHGVMISTTIQMPRSIPKEEGQKIYDKYLKTRKKGMAGIRFWYPSFWKPPSEVVLGYLRPELSSATKRSQCEIDTIDNSISFDTLHPEFADDHINRYRWANVIEIDNRFYADEIAVAYPNNLHDPSYPNLASVSSRRTLTTTEGLVIFPEFKNSPQHLRLQDGTTAIKGWFERRNVRAEISTPGKYVLQIVKAVGSLDNLSSIANPQLIKLLNKMAQKQIEWKNQSSDSPPKFYTGNTVQYSDLKREIFNINKNNTWASFSIEQLISGNVIKLGIEVKCSECESWNWHSIDALNYELKCESCLTLFSFPTSNPTNRGIRWAYRAVGPFSNPDYAGGAYSTVFSIRFFRSMLGFDNSNITWSTSLNLKFESGENLEADFLFWYERKRTFHHNYKSILVLGESKSFGNKSFEKKDILRLKSIAKKYPGSVFVFSTMKEELSSGEKKLIRSFALWGREYGDLDESRAPVIVLTATELFARHDLSMAWEEQGGKHAALINHAYISSENLRVLANLTQQLYLDLPSYGDWYQKKWEKLRSKQ